MHQPLDAPLASYLIRRQTEALFAISETGFNGMITSDKFCLSQSVRLNLHHWRRPLRLR
jgi:hypothetical protein